MKILALETSTKTGSICLSDKTRVLGEFQIAIKDSFSEILLPSIDFLLKSSHTSIQEVEVFALAQGPGSFTALRIGMSVVKGLALKRNAPVIPVPTLDGLAHNLPYAAGLLICPLIDARKGEVYTAFYKHQADHTLAKLTDDRVIAPERLIDEIDEEAVFLGDGSLIYADLIRNRLRDKAHFAPPNLFYPRATTIAFLALQKIEHDQVPKQTALLEPLYVRPPEAEVHYRARK